MGSAECRTHPEEAIIMGLIKAATGAAGCGLPLLHKNRNLDHFCLEKPKLN